MSQPFYKVTSWSATEAGAESELLLDKDHPLFQGHFPGLPILPGACMVQLTHHLADKFLEKKTTFVRASQVKFMAMVNPLNFPVLKSSLKFTQTDPQTCRIDHQMTFEGTVCFKISAFYSHNV